MSERIFFDPEEFRKGNFFALLSRDLTTEEGNSYELEDWVGRGGHASIFQCRERVTGEERAVKFLMSRGLQSAKRFLREVQLLRLVQGDHVTKYYGNGRVTIKHNKSHDVRTIPFIIMELADRNLQELIRSHLINTFWQEGERRPA